MRLICAIVFVGHWLDMYLLVMPSFMTEGPSLGCLEIGVGLGIGALFFLLFQLALRRAPLIPRKDPYLEESLQHHQS